MSDDNLNDKSNDKSNDKTTHIIATPYIATPYNIFSKSNKIYFTGKFYENVVESLINELDTCADILQSKKTMGMNLFGNNHGIYLYLNEVWGHLPSAYQICDHIQQMKVPVYTVMTGTSSHCTLIVSLAAKKRYCTPRATLLLDTIIEPNRAYVENHNKNIIQKTKIKMQELITLEKDHSVLDAITCVRYGFVDEILQ